MPLGLEFWFQREWYKRGRMRKWVIDRGFSNGTDIKGGFVMSCCFMVQVINPSDGCSYFLSLD